MEVSCTNKKGTYKMIRPIDVEREKHKRNNLLSFKLANMQETEYLKIEVEVRGTVCFKRGRKKRCYSFVGKRTLPHYTNLKSKIASEVHCDFDSYPWDSKRCCGNHYTFAARRFELVHHTPCIPHDIVVLLKPELIDMKEKEKLHWHVDSLETAMRRNEDPKWQTRRISFKRFMEGVNRS